MNQLTHRGYVGQVEVDTEARLLFGLVLGLNDVVTFEGESYPEIEQAFRESVDAYLAYCAEIGRAPEKPYSGRLPYRTSPERHRRIALVAAREGKSINAWIDETLAAAISGEP